MTTELSARLPQAGAVLKPTFFIGSSTQRLPIARGLKELLTDCAEVTVWDEAYDEFELGSSLLKGLIKVGELYDFTLLVFGQDDCTRTFEGSRQCPLRVGLVHRSHGT